ncbi:RIP homotypic interaction motif-containing protein [Actinosynnema sp. NPDC053489]|uniref:RIP homotypic interaction motif-containing protein n=1 Tax=Actinosynnema sp. NPDC053489 TaxID=3363916 RepID=UPI0037C6AB84
MIESVDFVMAALAAGAGAGLTDTASTAVKDSYASLKQLVVKAVGRKGAAPVTEEQVDDPAGHAQVRTALEAAGVAADSELVAAARKVLEATDPQGAVNGKYNVDLRDSKGVQVGDNNTMTINF